MSNKSASKEDILNRMYAHAASFWNISNIESLDPGIQYLIQGLASELFQLSNEMENIKVRILQNLTTVLTPDNFASPRCSHAIMQATPTEQVLLIDAKTSFFLDKLSSDIIKKGVKKLDFSPVSQIRLIRANINYLICERSVYRQNKGTDKSQLAFTNILTEKYNNSVWIALNLCEEVESLKNLSFYIDFPKNANRETYYSLSPFTKWEIGGEPLTIKSGLPVWEEENDENLFLFLKYDLLNMTNRNILKFYQKRFVTITSDIPVSSLKKQKFPEELEDLYDDSVYANFEPSFWVKVKFPPNIPATDLYNINICLNAFPVANRTLYFESQSQSKLDRIIPLRTEQNESFLSIDEVSDSQGNNYQHIPYKAGNKAQAGSYYVRQGGIERFDARDAHNTIEYLNDLLRSEISAFSGLGVEYLENVVRDMKKSLVSIETKMENQPELQDKNYLLVNSLDEDGNIFYSYWGTNCEMANGIGVGRTLTAYNTTLIEKGSCMFVSNTIGGKSAPDVLGRIDAFKYSLMTHDKINSLEDICNFCRYELSGKISNVLARRNVMVSPKPKEGLVRVIQILITPLPQYREVVENMKEEVKLFLEQRSPDTFNYQIIINQ